MAASRRAKWEPEPYGSQNTLHWGLDDPAEVEGSDAEKLGAIQRTYMEVNQRVRPFVEVALRAAGRGRTASLAG